MQLDILLTATLSAGAIGGTYEWSIESCSCGLGCSDCSSCIFFSTSTGTVVSDTVETTVNYYAGCAQVMIKLTITNIVDEEECISEVYYEIAGTTQGTQSTWKCTTKETGCEEVAGLNGIFDTLQDCLDCTNCPCSTSNACSSATFLANYDCDTHILLIDTDNAGDWCDGVTVFNYIDINQTLYNSQVQTAFTFHYEPDPAGPICGTTIPCAPAFPLSIDMSSNPFPNGIYTVDVIVSLNDCEVTIGNLWVSCMEPGGATNSGCCFSGSQADFQVNQQLQPPKVYTVNVEDISAITIDFYTFVQADKLSVFTTWDPDTETGTEVATTDFIGACGNPCNSYFALEGPPVDYYQGYREKIYDDISLTINYDTPCSGGAGNNTISPPNDFSYGGTAHYGAARIVLTENYINTLTITDNILYIVVYSNQTEGDPTCNTIWKFYMICDGECVCNPPAPPNVNITPELCGGDYNQVVQEGVVNISGCLFSTPQWSVDNQVTWNSNQLVHSLLPEGVGTLCVRCNNLNIPDCVSDSTCVSYNNPDCCSAELTGIVECNENPNYPENQYEYVLTFTVADCTDYVLEQVGDWNAGIYVTTPYIDSGDLIFQIYCHEIDSNPPVDLGQSYYNYTLTCSSCGTPQTLQIRPNAYLLDLIHNLACSYPDIKCCATIFVLAPDAPTLDGKLNLTVNGDPHLFTFTCAGSSQINFQNAIAGINVQLDASGLGVNIIYNPLDFTTYSAYQDDCTELDPYYGYTIINVQYNCNDEIIATLGFVNDYNVTYTSATNEITINEDGNTCTKQSPECGFCKFNPIIRANNTIVHTDELIFLNLDDIMGVGIGNAIGTPPYLLYITDESGNHIPNTEVGIGTDADCNSLTTGDGVFPLSPNFNNDYQSLSYNICYYIHPLIDNGLYTIHMEDGRDCEWETPLCVVDYEILTCNPVKFTCIDATIDGAQYFTGVTINGVLYGGQQILVSTGIGWAEIKAEIEVFLYSIPNITGGFTVTVEPTEPHNVTIIYYGCKATDFATHFTSTTPPNTPYSITDNTPTVAIGYTLAYLSDGPFTITEYSWFLDGVTLTPEDAASTTFKTADLSPGANELICTIEIECGSLIITKIITV